MIVQFGAFTLDSNSRLLIRDGAPLHLSRKAFDALCVLVERRPGAVTKEELHARLWPDTYVVDANLSVAIAEIRRAFGDDPQSPRFIRTVHRVGYAFCAESIEPAAGEAADERRAWFLRQDHLLALHDGDNVIGRDPDCHLWIDAGGVSRRHARVRVDGDQATLEDLGSKNGTFVNGAPVQAAYALSDGDRVRLGPVELDFRTRSSRPTETIRFKK